MKRSYSFKELPRLIGQIAPAGYLVSVTTNSISNLMKKTRGKEKVLALFQYSAELFKLTMTELVHNKKIKENPVHLINSIQIEKSMKNGRKLLRVLMFLDDIAYIDQSYRSWKDFDFLDVLQVMLNISNIVYYLLDNLVWCADIGIISKFIKQASIKWKDTKDFSSLARALLGLVISLVSSVRSKEKIKEYLAFFEGKETKKIKKNSNKMIKVESLINARREHRIKVIEVFNMTLRLVMIGHGLQFPVLRRCSKIFIAVCGILATILSIFNELIGEQVVTIEAKQSGNTNE